MKHEKALAWLAFAAVSIIWGTTYLAIRVAVETLPNMLFVAARFILGGGLLLLICLFRGERLPRRLSDYGNLAFIGVCTIGVGNVAVVWAERHVSSGFAALLVATAPFWMAALEALRPHGERLTPRTALGMILGFLGVGILVAPELHLSDFNTMFFLGVIVLQIGSIVWNIGSIRSKYHPIDAKPLMSAALQMVLGAIIVGIIGFSSGEASQFSFNRNTLLAFIYLTIFGSFIAYTAYIYALSKLKTSTVSLYSYINPAFAVVLGWAILDEPLGWDALLATIVIFAGVAVVQTNGKRSKAKQQLVVEAEEVHA